MKSSVGALCFCLAFSATQAFFFGSSPEWNGLKVGFSINPFTAFASQPTTVADAIKDGWTRDVSAGGCGIAGTKFNGDRYRYKNEQAIMLLFDKNGYIAGIQAGIPKTLSSYPAPNNAKYHVFNEEKDMWVVTAYFTDPATICTTGRTKTQVETFGTGNMLAFQVGPSAKDLLTVPLNENEVLGKTPFAKGKCFIGMGMHYWYDISTTMDCKDTFPVFLLYNSGRLNGFGWAFNPNYSNSDKWEHPTRSVFGAFMQTPPPCLGKDGPTSTLHIYMTNSPVTNFC